MEFMAKQNKPQEILSQKFQPWLIAGAVSIACLVFGSGFLTGVLFERSATPNVDEVVMTQQNVITEPFFQDELVRSNQAAEIDGLPSQRAEYALVCIGMSNGRQECADWLEKINGPLQDVTHPNLEVINCAVGSHAIERWNDDTYNDVLWQACIQSVQDAGLAVEDVKYVWHKAMVQYVRDEQNNLLPPYPAPNSAYYKFINELDMFAIR